MEKTYCFSFGSAAHFKTRKKFSNIYFHENDFGKKAMEKEFAMDWGKGGGTINRLAARASFQRPYKDQILTSLFFYTRCKTNTNSTEFYFFNMEQHQEEVHRRFLTAKKIPGIQRFHCFLPLPDGQIFVKFQRVTLHKNVH